MVVSAGGQAGTNRNSAECPHVIEIEPGQFCLFRNQRYGRNAQFTVYYSDNPLNFGINNDEKRVCTMPYAAPEVIYHQGKYYLDFIGDRQLLVEHLRVIRHPKGVYALVYNPATVGMGWSNDLAVILNLPEDYHPEFDAMNILFYDDPSLDVIEQVISSVRFTH